MNLIDSVPEIDNVLKKYGYKLWEDIDTSLCMFPMYDRDGNLSSGKCMLIVPINNNDFNISRTKQPVQIEEFLSKKENS